MGSVGGPTQYASSASPQPRRPTNIYCGLAGAGAEPVVVTGAVAPVPAAAAVGAAGSAPPSTRASTRWNWRALGTKGRTIRPPFSSSRACSSDSGIRLLRDFVSGSLTSQQTTLPNPKSQLLRVSTARLVPSDNSQFRDPPYHSSSR